MSRAARFFWVCAASATLCFVALAVVSKTMLEPGGLLIFDSRVWGYGPDEARLYLEKLDGMAQGRDTYLGMFHQLDTVFPLLLCTALVGGAWLLSAGLPVGVRAVLVLAPLGYLVTDILENAAVAGIIRAGAQVRDAVVWRASDLTQAKWALLAASLVVLVVLWRRAARRAMI